MTYNGVGLKKFLAIFEFGMFIRMGQIMILPFTYFAFLGLRVVAFDSTTKAFDFLLSFLYAILLLGFVAFGLYIINYAPLNLNSYKSLSRYGSLYAHMKYKRENKLISNEFCLRQILKMSMASIHVFGYFSPIAVSAAGSFLYLGFSVMMLGSFWFNGVYASVHQTFKMAVFHFVLGVNYIFAAAHVNREAYEIFIVSFL